MSTISVSNITTANGSETLTIATGNTNAGDIVLPATGGVVIAPNSVTNSVIISTGAVSNAVVINSTGIFFSANIASDVNVSAANLNFDNGSLFVDGTTNRVGIGNTAPGSTLVVTGNVNIDNGLLFVDGANNHVNVGSNVFTLGSSTNAASGFTILPNQLKMNWGVVVPNSIGSNTITFSSPFTTNVYSVQLTVHTSVVNTSAANAKVAYITSMNSSTVSIRTANNTVTVNTGVLGVQYLAIGPA